MEGGTGERESKRKRGWRVDRHIVHCAVDAGGCADTSVIPGVEDNDKDTARLSQSHRFGRRSSATQVHTKKSVAYRSEEGAEYLVRIAYVLLRGAPVPACPVAHAQGKENRRRIVHKMLLNT